MTSPTAAAARLRDGHRLVLGESVAIAGTFLAQLAFPLTAVLLLDASPADMAMLGILQDLPAFTIGVAAGPLIDRFPPARLVAWSNAARGVCMAAVPVLYFVHSLSMPALVVIALLSGTATAVHDASLRTLVPLLAKGEAVNRVNARLSAAAGIGRTLSMAAAGLLVSVVGAPATMTVTALTFAWGAYFVSRIAIRPAVAAGSVDAPTVYWTRLREGVKAAKTDPTIARVLLSTAIGGVAFGIGASCWTVHVTNTLRVAPSAQGWIYAVGGAATILAAVVAPRLLDGPDSRWVDRYRRFILGEAVIGSATLAMLALSPAGGLAAMAFLLAHQLINDPVSTWGKLASTGLKQRSIAPAVMLRVETLFSAAQMLALSLGRALTIVLSWWTSDTRTFLLIGAAIGAAAALPLVSRFELAAAAPSAQGASS